jgi:ATP-dependent DNA helicase RecG
MLAHEVDRGAVDWAGLRVSGATWRDLDPLEFERLRTMVSATSAGTDRVLASLADHEIASALGLAFGGATRMGVPIVAQPTPSSTAS